MLSFLFLKKRGRRLCVVLLALCLVLCLFSGCAGQDRGDISKDIEPLIAQMGLPIDKAFAALPLPGKPEDGIGEGIHDKMITGIYFEEAYTLLGRQVDIGLGRIGNRAPHETRLTAPLGIVFLGTRFQEEKDAEYAVLLYQALQKAYGDPVWEEKTESNLPFSGATASDIFSLQEEGVDCGARWQVYGQVLDMSADSYGVSITMGYPEYLYRPVFDENGERLGYGPYALPQPENQP